MAKKRPRRDLNAWRTAKAKTFKKLCKILPGSVGVAESLLDAFDDLLDAAQPVDKHDDRWLLLPMLVSSRRALLNAFQLLLEGQFLEAFGAFRPTAEMAGHALRISKDKTLAKSWMDRDVDEKEFNKKFKPHLPEDDPMTKLLFEFWKFASETGLHSNAKQVLFHFEADEKGMTLQHFMTDIPQVQLFLGYFIMNAAYILKIYAYGLGLYFGKNFNSVVALALTKAQDHTNLVAARFKRSQATETATKGARP